MKPLLFIFLLFLAACGQNSSPEGRMTLKIDEVHKQMDSLKHQNTIIMDSLSSMSRQLKDLEQQKK